VSNELEKRIERLESRLGEGQRIHAIRIAGWAAGNPSDADLTAPYVDGQLAWISRDHAVTFVGGSLQARQAIVERMRREAREKAAQEAPEGAKK
jgi:hypothetical protein